MTREEMREKVARALAETQGEIVNDAWRFYLDDADAAIALVMEEAAKECDRQEAIADEGCDKFTASQCATAIRALKGKP